MDGGCRATPVLVDPNDRGGLAMRVFRVLIYVFLVVPLVFSLTLLAVASAVGLVMIAANPKWMQSDDFWVFALLLALYLGGYLWWAIRWSRSRLATPLVLTTTIDVVTYRKTARGTGWWDLVAGGRRWPDLRPGGATTYEWQQMRPGDPIRIEYRPYTHAVRQIWTLTR